MHAMADPGTGEPRGVGLVLPWRWCWRSSER